MASETRMAIDNVTVNSRNSLPRMPPINKIGMNTAIRERLIQSTVNSLTSRAPAHGGLEARHSVFHMPGDVFENNDCVVDDETRWLMVSAISDSRSRL